MSSLLILHDLIFPLPYTFLLKVRPRSKVSYLLLWPRGQVLITLLTDQEYDVRVPQQGDGHRQFPLHPPAVRVDSLVCKRGQLQPLDQVLYSLL